MEASQIDFYSRCGNICSELENLYFINLTYEKVPSAILLDVEIYKKNKVLINFHNCESSVCEFQALNKNW